MAIVVTVGGAQKGYIFNDERAGRFVLFLGKLLRHYGDGGISRRRQRVFWYFVCIFGLLLEPSVFEAFFDGRALPGNKGSRLESKKSL